MYRSRYPSRKSSVIFPSITSAITRTFHFSMSHFKESKSNKPEDDSDTKISEAPYEKSGPCIFVFGGVGDGKSSFCNTILTPSHPFDVCHTGGVGTDKFQPKQGKFLEHLDLSFVKETNVEKDKLMIDFIENHQKGAKMPNLTVTDTPGINDEYGDLVLAISNQIKGINISTFTIVISAANPRMEPIVAVMKKLKEYVSRNDGVIANMLQHVSVVYTHWSYDKKSKKKREKKGITKEMRKKQINDALEEAFGKQLKGKINVPCFFIDNEVLMDEDGDDDEKIEILSELIKYYNAIEKMPMFSLEGNHESSSCSPVYCSIL